MKHVKLTTDEAVRTVFDELDPYELANLCNVAGATVYSWRTRFKQGTLSAETKRRILLATGHKEAYSWIKE